MPDQPRVGVLLSGCGVFDGSEIHEAVFTLLALDRHGAKAICCAPDLTQFHVIDHRTGRPAEGESRNVLVESARLARGQIEDLAGLTAGDLDALILPGGYGAAKNLCDFASRGAECTVHPEVARLVREMNAAGKPLGFICIAPALAARVLGAEGVELTIGRDPATARALEQCGARHVECGVREIHLDRRRKVVSTPAYMLGQGPAEVCDGIDRLVRIVLDLLA